MSSMCTLRCTLAVAVLATTALAQKHDLDALDAQLRWKIDEQGQLLLWPQPEHPDAEEFAPIFGPDLSPTLRVLGPAGWLVLACPGPADVASLTPEGLMHDRFGREAVVAAVAELTAPRPAGTLPPLKDVLADVPADSELVVAIDQTAMPRAQPLCAFSSELGVLANRRVLDNFTGELSLSLWASARRMADTPAMFPYEMARRFGNLRVDRTVLAVELDSEARIFWLHLEGSFDVDHARRGLEFSGFTTEPDESRLRFHNEGIEGEVTERRVRIWTHADIPMGPRRGAELEQRLTAGAPLAVAVLTEHPTLAITGLEHVVGLHVWPPTEDTELRAEALCIDDQAAKKLARHLRSLPELVQGMADGPEAERVAHALSQIEVEAVGPRVRASFAELDWRQLVRDALLGEVVR